MLRTTTKGFTLIELLVSVGLFSVVALVSIGSLLTIVDANRKALSMRASTDNIAYALDAMTRAIRTGYSYYCLAGESSEGTGASFTDLERSKSCINGHDAMVFTTADHSTRIAYRLNGTVVERRIGVGAWKPVTGSEIAIQQLRFVVRGTDPYPNTEQPSVTIIIDGTSGTGVRGTGSRFTAQTTVTQRRIDVY